MTALIHTASTSTDLWEQPTLSIKHTPKGVAAEVQLSTTHTVRITSPAMAETIANTFTQAAGLLAVTRTPDPDPTVIHHEPPPPETVSYLECGHTWPSETDGLIPGDEAWCNEHGETVTITKARWDALTTETSTP